MAVDPISPILSAASSGVVTDLYVGAKRWFAKLDPDGSKLRDYHDGLLKGYGWIQIMGMAAPRKLENIYVRLRAAPNLKKLLRDPGQHTSAIEKAIVEARKYVYNRETVAIDQFIADMGFQLELPHDIPEPESHVPVAEFDYPEEDDGNAGPPLSYLQSPEFRNRSSETLEFVQKHDALIVVGAPGSGKTTFLKYLALVYSGHIESDRELPPLLPIFVPIREFRRIQPVAPSAEWLRDLVLSCASDLSPRSSVREWIDEALKLGRCLVLLDGLDEVPVDQMGPILQSIHSFSAKFRNNKIVVTSRAAAFDRAIEGFSICEMDDFSEEDTQLFLRHWYGADSADALRLTVDIKASNLAKELCRTPLLLTLICVLYGYRRSIPANRAELYGACVDALLFQWDTFRSVDRGALTPVSLDPERKKLLLSRVAYRAFDRGVIYFRGEELRELVQTELNYLNLDNVPSGRFVKEVESHNGLLVEYAPDVFCFSHLTFHEFFTALYYHDSKDYEELFNKALNDPRYYEVYLMCLEKMYYSDTSVMYLISAIKNRCLDTGIYNEYLHVLVGGVLACNAVMNCKLRALLREIDIELERLEIIEGDRTIDIRRDNKRAEPAKLRRGGKS